MTTGIDDDNADNLKAATKTDYFNLFALKIHVSNIRLQILMPKALSVKHIYNGYSNAHAKDGVASYNCNR